ncbi:MAG: bifunctional diguanylate cyclase/phosphodiesterase, partial [Cyanobacteria bacterium P01_H01_bin.130]
DELLVAIARRLAQYCDPKTLVARLGEDEFGLLLRGISSVEELTPFLEGLLERFRSPFATDYGEFFMTVSAGVTLGTMATEQSPGALLQEAETAMYHAKRRGKGSWQVFDREMHLALLRQLTLENDLQRSLQEQDFVTYYQPIVDLQTGQVAGVEALVRWQHPGRGLVPPGVFIPCMEATGLVIRVGMMVFRQAARQMHRWHTQGWSHLTLSVNLSVRQFSCVSLLSDIDGILAETGLDPNRLKFEITESAIMESASEAVRITDALRSRQIEISIDDFGTGYSSLGHLHQFSLDNLKVDRSFVNQIETPQGHQSYVVNTIIALSQQLGLSVIAEGIETEGQLQHLRDLGCEYGQGFFFAKPLPAAEFEARYLHPTSGPTPSALTSAHRPQPKH